MGGIIIYFGGCYMEYLTIEGEKWKIIAKMVNYYCSMGFIDGAIQKGNLLLIPANAEKPSDTRIG